MRRAPTPLPLVLAAIAIGALAVGCGEDDSGPTFGHAARTAKDLATFYVNGGAEPEYLDPGKSADSGSATLIIQMFEGLTAADPRDSHPIQGVAERFEQSDDSRLFRFHLRPDARWSDGVPVTAGDFEYAWRRVLRPKTASRSVANLFTLKNGELFNGNKLKALAREVVLPNGERLPKGAIVKILRRAPAEGTKIMAEVERFDDLPTYGPRAPPAAAGALLPSALVDEADLVEDPSVVGVRATDPLTLEVELERPAPYFTELTSFPTLFPVRKDVVEPFEARGDPDLWIRPGNIVTNGPYTLDAWRFRDEITMKQNAYYWNRDKLKIHRIVWVEVEDNHASMNLYKAGEIDHLGDNMSIPAEYQERLRSKRDYVLADYLAAYWYELNTKKPPLDDVRVRRALNLAIDKRALVEKVTRGGQRPATHFVPDFTGNGYADQAAADRAAGADPFAGPEAEFNPEGARALMEAAGYPPVKDGDGYHATGCPPIEILYNTGEGNRLIAVAVQDMWRKNLGVIASIRSEEWKVMLKNYRDGQFQVMRSGWTAEYNHPLTFLDPFRGASLQNQTGWADPAYDEALKRAMATKEPRESARRYREAEAIAVRAMPRIPLYFYTHSTLRKPWVKGFSGLPRGSHLIQFLWIDPSGKAENDAPAFTPLELPAPGGFLP